MTKCIWNKIGSNVKLGAIKININKNVCFSQENYQIKLNWWMVLRRHGLDKLFFS